MRFSGWSRRRGSWASPFPATPSRRLALTSATPAQQRNAIVEVNTTMAALALARGIAFVDIFDISAAAGTDRSLVADDGLHPSEAQYRRWLERILPVVKGLLER